MATVIGNNAAETINAADGVTNGNDTIYGLDGNDAIFGLGGADMIKGGGGADGIDGGDGFDTVNYTDSAEGVLVNLETGRGYYGTAAGDQYFNIEHVYGSSYADVLIGDTTGNILAGWGGSDMLKGGGGNDVLYAGTGDDWLQGGTGADYIEGGDGIDTADYSGSTGAVNIDLGTGIGAWAEAAGDQLDSVENLTGSAFNDVLIGGAAANVLQGGAGADELYGLQGDDSLVGGTGGDHLVGGAGDDTLAGGIGNDVYVVDDFLDDIIELAAEGHDEMQTFVTRELSANVEILTLVGADDISGVGNGGHNVLSGNSGDNGLDGGAGWDTVAGGAGDDVFYFAPGQAQGDIVVDFDGNGAAAGDALVFNGFGPGATFTYVDNTHWQLTYNDGASVEVITFLNGGANNIHASDLVFV